MCTCMCVCGGGGSTGGLVVETPVYNTSAIPAVQVFFHHTTPHPAAKWVPSMARVDKTTDCGTHNILTSDGPGGTLGAHTTNTDATVSAPASTWPGFRSLFCTGP